MLAGSSGRALQGMPGSVLEIPVPTGVTVRSDFGTILGTVLSHLPNVAVTPTLATLHPSMFTLLYIYI